MTNKATKRALLTSIMAFIICAVMLIGTTFAWFTDSVVSGKNQIVAGNLDVELYYDNDVTDSNDSWTKVASDTNVFKKNTLWEPGHTEIVKLKVANEGSLALKYQFMLDVASETEGENVAGDKFKLSDYIMFGITTENVTTREAAIAAVKDNSVRLNEGITEAGNLEKGKESVVTMVVYMPTTVDNVANHKTGTPAPTIDFGLKLLATQYTYESDSFNNLYDENATYGKTIYLDEGADLLAALAEGDEDLPLTVILNGNVNYKTDGHHNENDVTPASDVVIDGQGKYGITFTGAGVTPVGDSKASLTLKNLTVNDDTVSYDETAWELSYLEMGSPDLTCTNVTFNDPISVDSKNATFMSCTFKGYEDTGIITMYGVWMYNGDATFTGCTFNGTRGMKICDRYDGGEVGTVVIDGCTFNNLTQKPGVVIDDHDTQDMKITIKNSTFINCKAGDAETKGDAYGEVYVYETDNTKATTSNNTVINGAVTEVSTAAELLALGGQKLEGCINITADIDLNGVAMPTIGAAYGKELTVIGNGHTISNASTAHTNHNGMKHHGFFYAYTNSTLTINNLKFDGITIDATADTERNYGAGIVVSFADDGSNVTLNNVDITNCVIKNNTPDIGDEAGVYVGYQTGTLTMTDCDSTGCSVAGETTEKTGAFIGMVNGTATLTNCTTDLTIGTCNRVAGTLTEN